jgi:hypothetical protein
MIWQICIKPNNTKFNFFHLKHRLLHDSACVVKSSHSQLAAAPY